MSRLAAPKTEFHTLHLRSRVLGEIIKELNLNEIRVTKMVISADKVIEHTSEKHPIPELERYFGENPLLRETNKKQQIRLLPLNEVTEIEERINNKAIVAENGIDLAYINKVLTEPPYSFPYVRVEEFDATILQAQEPLKEPEKAKLFKRTKEAEPEKPAPIPEKIKFKRTAVKQANIVSTLKPQPHGGPKYTLELVTTRKKESVERIRNIIAEHDPIKFCELVMKSDVITVCKEILGKED